MQDRIGLVQRTFDELGFKIRSRGYWVWVRTETYKEKIGSIWLPPRLSSFHGELPHLINIGATVLSSGTTGAAKQFKAGDRIWFTRLYFGYQWKMEDGTFVGWIDANQVSGFADEEDELGQFLHQAGTR